MAVILADDNEILASVLRVSLPGVGVAGGDAGKGASSGLVALPDLAQELIPEFMYDAAERAQFMKSVTLLPNPCVISVNEVKIGINAADIMRHLLPEDVHRVV